MAALIHIMPDHITSDHQQIGQKPVCCFACHKRPALACGHYYTRKGSYRARPIGPAGPASQRRRAAIH